jgi:hypothetical protein
VFLDAIVVKVVRDTQVVQNKTASIAIGSTPTARSASEHMGSRSRRRTFGGARKAARFRGLVMNDLENRGARDMLVACCDGLSGFEDVTTGAFLRAEVQRCVPTSSGTRCGPVARRDADEAAFDAVAAFAASLLGEDVPAGRPGLGKCLGRLHPFPAFSPAVRKLLYTRQEAISQATTPSSSSCGSPLSTSRTKRARERLASGQQTGMRSD